MDKLRLAAVLAVAAGSWAVTAPAAAEGGFNDPGNILVADQFNNRAIEINRDHQIVWSFGDGSTTPGPHSIVGLNDAERVGRLTLLAGTGAPEGAPTEPACEKPGGCPDNRVILVDRDGEIVWQYGQEGGKSGAGENELNVPVFAAALPEQHVLITDQGNSRVIEVNRAKKIVWEYGKVGEPGGGPNQLNNPNSAELLANGHILIADENNNRVIEVTRAKKIVWEYGEISNTAIIKGAAFASRLPNHNTLITDSGNSRVLEVTPAKKVVWSYVTSGRKEGTNESVEAPLPTRAVRLRNGDTLISDQFNDQVIEVNHAKEAKILFTQGILAMPGAGPGLLNAPYDAKQIGDYTGLTPPFGFGDEGDHD